jgi:hypothetical protein
MLRLLRSHRHVPLARRRGFLRSRPDIYSARATIVADARVGDVVVHHRGVIHVVDHRGIDVGHALVVVKFAASPIAAIVAASRVAEAIVDSTIEANFRPPITIRPEVGSFAKRPVTGCPQ